MIEHFPKVDHTTRLFLRLNTRLKAFTGPVHCQNLSQNGHRGTTKSFSGQTQDKNKSFCSCQHTTNFFLLLFFINIYFFIFLYIYIFFFHEKTLPQVEHMTKKKFSVRTHHQKSTKTKTFLRFNSRPNISSGRSHK